jgi:hypothetical protein
MKFRWVIASLLSAAISCTVMAQSPRSKTKYKDEARPALEQVLSVSKTATELPPVLLSVTPQVPLGPDYVLQGYENEMTLISQKMSVEMQSIERALRSGQITHAQAEFLIQQRYQVAMMQYEVFTALHDGLEQEIQQAANQPKSNRPSDSDQAVRARLAVSSSHSQDQ